MGDVLNLLRDGLDRSGWDVDEAAGLELDEELACACSFGRRLGRLTDATEPALIDELMIEARDTTDRDGTRDVIVRFGRWREDENDDEDPVPLLGSFSKGFERSRGVKTSS